MARLTSGSWRVGAVGWREAVRPDDTVAEALVPTADPDPWLAVYADPPWVLHLVGELDVSSAPSFSRALEDLAAHSDDMGLDLAELTFIDSTGVRTLCDAARLVGDRGRVTVYRPSQPARRVIEMSGLVGTIDISDEPVPSHIELTAGSHDPAAPRPIARARQQYLVHHASQGR